MEELAAALYGADRPIINQILRKKMFDKRVNIDDNTIRPLADSFDSEE